MSTLVDEQLVNCHFCMLPVYTVHWVEYDMLVSDTVVSTKKQSDSTRERKYVI